MKTSAHLDMLLEVGAMFKASSTTLASERPDGRMSAHVALQRASERIAAVAVWAHEWLRSNKVFLLRVFTQTRRAHERLGAELARIATLLPRHVVYRHVLCQVRRIRESLVADWTAMWLHILMVDLHMLHKKCHSTSDYMSKYCYY